MSVPAIARARNMICNSIATIPMITRDKTTGAIVDQPVVISADKDVRYEEVIIIMDVLQRQHIKKVGLLAQTKGR